MIMKGSWNWDVFGDEETWSKINQGIGSPKMDEGTPKFDVVLGCLIMLSLTKSHLGVLKNHTQRSSSLMLGICACSLYFPLLPQFYWLKPIENHIKSPLLGNPPWTMSKVIESATAHPQELRWRRAAPCRNWVCNQGTWRRGSKNMLASRHPVGYKKTRVIIT